MPVRLRTLGPNLIVAGYWFSEKEDEPEKFDWPWLHEPLRNNNLCANCSCLNFTWLFTHGLSGHTIDIDDRSTKLSDGICLGVYKDILKRSRCQFCKLVVHALEYAADVEMLNQYDDWPEQEVWINNHFFDARGMVVMVPAEHAYKCIARLGIRLKSASEDNLIFLHGGRRVMIQEIRSDFSSAAGMRLSRDSEALVQTIKNWTRFCQLRSPRHTPLQTYNGSIRLVDTYNQCITGPIAMTSIDHYVALSYIWGKIDPLVLLAHNETELRKKGALNDHKARLPATIQDAINLCARLGERYLWVDSLCIVQDTPDKHSQIQRMDQIYLNAGLCIVAAAGRDANTGLAGVSRPREDSQHIAEVDGIQLANVLPDLDQSITQTYWSRRAWCFQEDLLSQQKIVFTSDQTYYNCQHGKFAEDAHSTAHDSSSLTSLDPSWLSQMEGRSNWDIYCETIENYTGRMLSFDADVLNAFAGISAFLSKTLYSNSPFVMGIPICSLEAGLLWRPNARVERRAGTSFASWSWAGWKAYNNAGFLAYVEYSNTQDHEKCFDRIIRQVDWHTTDRHDLVSCLPETSWDGWKSWTRVVSGDVDDIHYAQNASGPGRKYSHPIVDQKWPTSPYSPLLRCTAEIAQMTLTSEHTDLWTEESYCEHGHDLCHLKIRDHLGRFAGVIIMDGRTYETLFEQDSITQKSCSFMKISRTTLTSQDDPAWNPDSKTFAGEPGEPGINPNRTPLALEDEFDSDAFDRNICWCMYNVLLVSFDDNVATRLAVGRVYYAAFDDAHPEKKKFCLG